MEKLNKKVILAIADGIGDRPIPDLGNQTPLEYANTPHLDQLAKEGASGIVDIIGPGIPIGTDIAHMILFGYRQEDYPGRGPLEALGRNIVLEPGDIAFRANFATVDDKFNVIDRRAGRIRKDTNRLAESINGLVIDGVKVLFQEATEHRALLVLKGENLSAQITDTDPKIENHLYKKAQSTDQKSDSEHTAEILNKFLLKANQILTNHEINTERIKADELPANFILTRGAGIMPDLPKTTDKLNFKAACIAAEGTVQGAARLAGFEVVSDKRMTGNLDTDITVKADKVIEAIADHDFVAFNLKSPDLMGHDGKPNKKVEAIELFDELIGKIMKEDLKDTIIAVTGDHSTPCEREEHSGEPVPVLIHGPGIRKDRNERYNEIDCAHGGLGRIKGHEFVSTLYDYLELVKKEGN